MKRLPALIVAALVASLVPGVGSAEPATWRTRVPKPAVSDATVPGRLVIRTEPGARPHIAALGARLGARSREARTFDAFSVDLPAGVDPEQAAASYEALPGVLSAEPAVPIHALGVPNDPLYSDQYYLETVDAPEAWDITTGDPTGIVAVIDTGVRATHQDLVGRVLPGRDFVNDDLDATDDHGHGTQIAGILGATTNNGIGVAGMTRDRILPVKVLGSDGSGDDFLLSDGIRWAVDNGATVINMSLGSAGYSKILSDAVNYALSRDVVVVAGSGNDGRSLPFFPASFPGVLSVGATDADDEIPAWGPNYGSTLGVVAPGTSIRTTNYATDSSYIWVTGTSTAAPVVSGIAALVRARFPVFRQGEVTERIRFTADDLGLPGRDRFYGSGRVNAFRAVGGNPPQPPAQSEPAGEPANTLEAAQSLAGTTQATIYPAGDQDWWRIDVPAGGHLSVSVDPPVHIDPAVDVYGPGFDLVEVIDFGFEGDTEAIDLDIIEGGTYHIGVRNWLPHGSKTDPYSITLAAGTGSGGLGFVSPIDPERHLFTWYDHRGSGGRNWLMTSMASGVEGAYQATLASDDMWSALVSEVSSDPQRFGAMRGGPVEVRTYTNGGTFLSSQRTLWRTDNFEEVPAVTEDELTTHAWFSWYDGKGTGGRDWVLATNPGPWSATARILLEGTVVAEQALGPGENLIWNDSSRRGGPVEVISVEGRPLLASRRTLWKQTNFSELPGIAGERLASDYLFPWYDARGTQGQNWVLIANPESDANEVRVRIGPAGAPLVDQTFQVAPGETVTPTFPGVRGGPVRVTSESGRPFVVTQRSLFDGGRSFEEVAGVPVAELGDTVHYSWYDAIGSADRDWVLVSNPSASETVDVTITIGGNEVWAEAIPPGAIRTPRFTGMRGGPVTVSSTGPIVSSRRTLWQEDFTELIGVPS